MVKLGYDPHEMAAMFTTLERYGKIAGGGTVPEWASTHPAPENRVAATMARVDKLPPTAAGLSIGRDALLRQVDGMTFDENPRQGYFVKEKFFHPDLEFVLDFPAGWKVQNGTQAVVAQSPKGDALIVLDVAGKDAPKSVGEKFASQEGIVASDARELRINGLEAWRGYFKATTQQGELGGLATFVAHGGTTWRILGLTSGAKLDSVRSTFDATAASFTRLTDKAALAVQPARVSLVRADRDMTIEEFALRYVVADDPNVALRDMPPKVREAIKAARIARGMTRAQVLMAVGYPIASATPELNAPLWRYWTSGSAEFQVFSRSPDVHGGGRDKDDDDDRDDD